MFIPEQAQQHWQEEALTKAWQHFLNDLATVKAEIDQRNQKRTIKNVNSDPSISEVSIAK